jgi:hypothetical protein
MDFDNITTNIDDEFINTTNSSIIYIMPEIIETYIIPTGLIFGLFGFILCCCSQFRSGGKRESFTIMTKPIQADTPPKYSDESFRSAQTLPVYSTFVYEKNLD